jgi:hypothetical protein
VVCKAKTLGTLLSYGGNNEEGGWFANIVCLAGAIVIPLILTGMVVTAFAVYTYEK